jgi:hypothetical protein
MAAKGTFHPVERRDSTRVEISRAAVVLARHNAGVAMTIESISTGGARLVGGVTLAVGERIQILFEIDQRPVEVLGEVVRAETQDITTDRIAVRFVELTGETRELIRQLVLQTLEEDGAGGQDATDAAGDAEA